MALMERCPLCGRRFRLPFTSTLTPGGVRVVVQGAPLRRHLRRHVGDGRRPEGP